MSWFEFDKEKADALADAGMGWMARMMAMYPKAVMVAWAASLVLVAWLAW